MQHADHLREFVAKIWQWYARHKRELPWRDVQVADDTQRAYMVLVSEVMLQQTQVSRVQIIFKQFLERFPTIEHLAHASNRDVLIAWRGMGYNSRALRLRDAARAIVMGREFPRSIEELTAIPGIGPYTAAAIRNFAFGIPTPCVDTNIERILTRVFGLKGKKRAEENAGEVLRVALEGGYRGERRYRRDRRRYRATSATSVSSVPSVPSPPTANWHSALMDFGSLVCTKRSPKCAQCPLSKGICKSAFRVPPFDYARDDTRKEPGRMVGSRFIPNRIFRGKVVDLLRDAPGSMTLEAIGRNICLDWSREHRSWLQGILTGLCRDSLLKNRKRKYVLS